MPPLPACYEKHGKYIWRNFTTSAAEKLLSLVPSNLLDWSQTDIIFDILYHEDRSLIHLPLRERHEILKKVVTPLKHRIEVLVPDAELNREPGEALSYGSSVVGFGKFCCGSRIMRCCAAGLIMSVSIYMDTPAANESAHSQNDVSRPVKDLLGVFFWSLSRIQYR
jgi:hypothetical protein